MSESRKGAFCSCGVRHDEKEGINFLASAKRAVSPRS
jgi:methylphosphotriester-DNA--protein-cysteine methyltransferase